MSDRFSTISIEQLLQHILEEEKYNSIFGIHKKLFFTPSPSDSFQMKRYGQTLETPIGVAAGPHTQMAQNIIAAWLTGARYMELKTIQTLDQLEISKPCIDMEDEGYNCEWSQELLLKESFDEYLNAWIVIHILRHKFGWDTIGNNSNNKGCHDPGFIFNMSVGYNMEGILKDNVQWFLDKMKNCGREKDEKIDTLVKVYPAVKDIDIPNQLSDNITLSTMHGCPPDEIEKIAAYLVEEKKYHTTIKLNPTLLGPEMLRNILNESLGFETNVPDEAFNHDLKYTDALKIISSLRDKAEKNGVAFGLKLTNTLESMNHRPIFPEKETMMYMSGRALHPLSINLAAKIREDFQDIDISFSGGADCFNLPDIIACDLKPVTVCSDILKPGGYGRLSQYLENLAVQMKNHKTNTIEDFIISYQGPNQDGKKEVHDEKTVQLAALTNLKNYAAAVIKKRWYKKEFLPDKSIKTQRPLPTFDCIQAPCVTTCPTNQDIPDYMYYTATGDFQKAFEIILRKNPFPAVTGKVCDHPCMTKCTRQNYDTPLNIRGIKNFAAVNHPEEPVVTPAPKNGLKAAIIGAGPSGLSCAYYLTLAGFEVTVYEAKGFPGGMVSDAIPMFRLKDEDIKKDIARIETLGVSMVYDRVIDAEAFKQLQLDFDYIYAAVGAQVSTPMNIKGESLPGVTDALSFLSAVRRGQKVQLGSKVAVVGGGNSAMDAARTAKRLVNGNDAEVVVLYRRTRKEMPAADEEIEEAIHEGIVVKELTTPAEIEKENGGLNLLCWKMKLGDKDESGRRRPIKIENADFNLTFDTVIMAIGQKTVLDFMEDRQWQPVSETGQTALGNVFIGGDALHGPMNIITAIGDGKRAAFSILTAAGKREALGDFVRNLIGIGPVVDNREMKAEDYQLKAAHRIYGEDVDENKEETAIREAQRCLLCNDVCNVCVSVCPNRANVSYVTEPREYRLQEVEKKKDGIEIKECGVFKARQKNQVYNIADFCNHCGNCETFCPTAGAPYKVKPRVCLTRKSFDQEPDAFFVDSDKKGWQIEAKKDGKPSTLALIDGEYVFATDGATLQLDKETFTIKNTEMEGASSAVISLMPAIEMKILLDAIGK